MVVTLFAVDELSASSTIDAARLVKAFISTGDALRGVDVLMFGAESAATAAPTENWLMQKNQNTEHDTYNECEGRKKRTSYS